MDIIRYKVITIQYSYCEYHLGSPAPISDEGSFYRIDGTHIFDKFKIQFTYTIRGAEMFVSSRSKSITRSTVMLAYHKVKEKEVTGPKMIGVHGDSYIFAVFKGLGVIE